MPGRDRVGLGNDLGPHGHLPVYGTNAVTTAPMHPLLLLLVIIRDTKLYSFPRPNISTSALSYIRSFVYSGQYKVT